MFLRAERLPGSVSRVAPRSSRPTNRRLNCARAERSRWCPVTLQEMRWRLHRAGVPDWFYVTDGSLGAGECVGIEPTADGWTIYYSERGRKSPLEQCADEDRACRAMLRHIDRMMRQ